METKGMVGSCIVQLYDVAVFHTTCVSAGMTMCPTSLLESPAYHTLLFVQLQAAVGRNPSRTAAGRSSCCSHMWCPGVREGWAGVLMLHGRTRSRRTCLRPDGP